MSSVLLSLSLSMFAITKLGDDHRITDSAFTRCKNIVRKLNIKIILRQELLNDKVLLITYCHIENREN